MEREGGRERESKGTGGRNYRSRTVGKVYERERERKCETRENRDGEVEVICENKKGRNKE